MKTQFTLIGLFAIILLVISPSGSALPEHRLVLRDENNDTNIPSTEITTPIPVTTSTTSGDAESQSINGTATTIPTIAATTTTTLAPDTTTTIAVTTTTTLSPDTTTTVSSSSTDTPPIETSTSSSVAPIILTTITPSTTTKGPGRKFDGPSFVGGMILVVGLGALIYLVVRYLRRNNELPYANLH